MRLKMVAKHMSRCVVCLLICVLFVSKSVVARDNVSSMSQSTIYKSMLAKVEVLVDKLDWDNMSVKEKRKFFKKVKDVTEGLKEVNKTIAEKSNVKIFSDKLVSDVTTFVNKNVEEIDCKHLKATFSGFFTAAFNSVSTLIEDNPRVLSLISSFQDNSSVSVIYDLMNS